MLASRTRQNGRKPRICCSNSCAVLGVSRSSRCDALGLVLCDGCRLRMVAPGFSHNYCSCPHACHVQPDFVLNFQVLISEILFLQFRKNE